MYKLIITSEALIDLHSKEVVINTRWKSYLCLVHNFKFVWEIGLKNPGWNRNWSLIEYFQNRIALYWI